MKQRRALILLIGRGGGSIHRVADALVRADFDVTQLDTRDPNGPQPEAIKPTPDLIIVTALPPIGGAGQLLARLRRGRCTTRAPVLFYVANESVSRGDLTAAGLGPVDELAGPSTTRQLLAKVESLLSRDGARHTADAGERGSIICVYPDGRFFSAGRFWREMIGLTRTDLNALRLGDVVDKGSRESLQRCLDAAANGEGPQPFAAFFLAADGRRIPTQGSVAAAVKDHKEGPLVLTLRTLYDRQATTELQQRLHAEIERRDHCEASLAAVNELAGSLTSHLMTLSAGFDLLERHVDDSSELTEPRLAVKAAINDMAGLLRNIEMLMPFPLLSPEPVPMATMIERQLEEVANNLPVDVRLHGRVPSDLWPVDGDASQLETAISHLLSHAVDALGNKGEIELAAMNVVIAEPIPALLGAGRGEYVQIDVRDSGPGFPDAEPPRPFAPTFANHGSSEPLRGLALAQVRGIAIRHQGLLHCDSPAGGQKTLTLLLPRSTRLDEVTVAAHEAPAPPIPPSRFLVVDDEPLLVRSIQRMLRGAGHRCHGVGYGSAAVEFFREHPETIDYALIDIRLPDISGIDVMQQILAIKPNARVILMSALRSTFPTANDGNPPRHAAFLQKPFGIAELEQILAKPELKI